MVRRTRCCLVIFICALLGACSKPTERPPLTFTGRLLLLSGGASNGADLMELTAAPEGQSYGLSTIASGVLEAAGNGDQSQLLYATKDEIALRDLHSGALKSIIKGEAFCLAWSPDGQHFSYKQKQGAATRLYVSDLDGKTKLIWEDASGIERGDPHY